MSLTGFILAAGLGTRLYCATANRAKACVPLMGIKLIEHCMSHIKNYGVTSIGVNCHHFEEELKTSVKKLGDSLLIPTWTSIEETLLDTGGGLYAGLHAGPKSQLCLVHNVDAIVDFDLQSLIEKNLNSQAPATLLLVKQRGPRTVAVNESGNVTNLRLKRGLGTFTFTGVYVINVEKFLEFKIAPRFSIVDYFDFLIETGQVIDYVDIEDSYWVDLSTLQDYYEAHRDVFRIEINHHISLKSARNQQLQKIAYLQESGVEIHGAFGISEGVKITESTKLHDVILWENSELLGHDLVCRAIIQEQPYVDKQLAANVADDRIYRTLRIRPDETTISPIMGGGSGRTYFRIQHYSGKSWILSQYRKKSSEDKRWPLCREILAQSGVSVPDVYAHFPDIQTILMQDLGVIRLDCVSDMNLLMQWYKICIGDVSKLHLYGVQTARKLSASLEPPLDSDQYTKELFSFKESFLRNYVKKLNLWTDKCAYEWSTIVSALSNSPKVIIHRDLQSTNLMVYENRLWFIDFQGMRLGPSEHDYASLLFDPLHMMSDNNRQLLISDLIINGVISTEKLYSAAVLRLLQALSAYSRLSAIGFIHFKNFIKPAIEMLKSCSRQIMMENLIGFADDTYEILDNLQYPKN